MEQARHAASTKRHARHELQNRRKRKPVFLRMMGVLLVTGAALACFGFWRFQTPGIVLGPFEDEPSTAESVPPPEPEPQPVTTTLRFSATGDNLIHAPIYKQAARRAAEGQRYNFDYCYEHLLDFYAAQDVNWINQETLCSKELEPSTYPCFSTPGECAEALYRAGIRVFSLSNNHTYDKGAKGIAATLRFWDEMPEDVVTTGLWYGESDYGTIPLQTVNGVTIAYLSYTDHTNGIPQSSAMTANVIYTSQRDVMEQQVRRARELADFVVVGVHWGVEDSHKIHPDPAGPRPAAFRLGCGCYSGHAPSCGAGCRVEDLCGWPPDLCGLFSGKFPQHPEQTGSAHRCHPDTGAEQDDGPGWQRSLRCRFPAIKSHRDPL